MVPAEQAERCILDLVTPLTAPQEAESLNLQGNLRDALGRVLAAPVDSALDFPHWDNSAMDGYAVRYADVQSASADQPVTLTLVEEIPAGVAPQRSIAAGQAARIFTGAMLPLGADTIVIQEVTERRGDRVVIQAAPKPNAFVRYRASFHRAGDRLFSPGIVLTPSHIAALTAAQCVWVSVYRRVRVAILSTGNELVSPDQPLHPGQVVDSNRYALTALVQQAGAEPLNLGIVPDDPTRLKGAIAQALATSDVVLSSGGVSVGDYDYVDQILTELGGTLHIRSVAVKPGKPLTVATFPNRDALRSVLYFGLPGNPVSALVSFWRFVQPAIKKLSGQAGSWAPLVVKGRSRQELWADGKREAYVWGKLFLRQGEYEFEPMVGGHSSGNLINLAGANALAIVPISKTHVAQGEVVQILQIGLPEL
jgi:molybdopterin molybdotransferase